MAAAVLLGFWQLDAWQERRAAEARDLTRAEPVPLAEVMGPDDPFPGDRVGQPVDLERHLAGRPARSSSPAGSTTARTATGW